MGRRTTKQMSSLASGILMLFVLSAIDQARYERPSSTAAECRRPELTLKAEAARPDLQTPTEIGVAEPTRAFALLVGAVYTPTVSVVTIDFGKILTRLKEVLGELDDAARASERLTAESEHSAKSCISKLKDASADLIRLERAAPEAIAEGGIWEKEIAQQRARLIELANRCAREEPTTAHLIQRLAIHEKPNVEYRPLRGPLPSAEVDRAIRIDDAVEQKAILKRNASIREEAGQITEAPPQLLAIVPDENALRSKFKVEPTQGRIDEIERLSKEFKRLDGDKVTIASSANFGQRDLEDWLQNAGDGEPLILIGHSVDADGTRRVFLPSGESLTQEQIKDLACRSRRECLILTCHGEDFGLTRDVSMLDALSSCRAGLAKWQNGGGSLEELVAEMTSELERCQSRRATRAAAVVTVAVVVPVGAFGAYIIRSTTPSSSRN
jgi:hypothetical protein